MASTLGFEKIAIRTCDLAETEFPDLLGGGVLQNDIDFSLGEDEEIYEGYGTASEAFPYRRQNLYSRKLVTRDFEAAVLENDHLRATFLPELGGRLWSLVDKDSGRNLLYTNDVIRFSNLGILDAWFSGGVEWNIGLIGHSPFTAKPVYVALLESDEGYPVLRMYEYERARGVVYQMDFMLPEGSHSLLARMRVVNESGKVVPMYWWSNIAFPEYEGGRIAVPAESAYTFSMDGKGRGSVKKVGIPYVDGIDVSRFCDIPRQVDYFFDMGKAPVKFIAGTDRGGFGLLHVSTSRLVSRKLFSWGHNQGSDNWQAFLTDKAGRYLELQAGLGKTQYGCIPMAPMTSWEWLESYSAVQLDAGLGWNDFCAEAGSKASTLYKTIDMDSFLAKTRESIAKKPGKLVGKGSDVSGFLRHIRTPKGQRALAKHLEFPFDEEKFSPWLELVESGRGFDIGPGETPGTFFSEDEIFEALLRLEDRSWYMEYALSLCFFARRDYERALGHARLATDIGGENVWVLHALSAIMMRLGRKKDSAMLMMRAVRMMPDSTALAKDAVKTLLLADEPGFVRKAYDEIFSASVRSDGRISCSYMVALFRLGLYEEAYSFFKKRGLVVPDDIREGSDELETIYKELLVRTGRESEEVPASLRFRSF